MAPMDGSRLPSGLVVGPDTTLAHFKADGAFASGGRR